MRMISVCILTKNAAATLQATLDSVRSFSEVILLDNGSTDDTHSIARTYSNVKIFQSPFIGFGPLRNRAVQFASHDWILFLDSDEILSPSLQAELAHLTLHPDYAYTFPRHNYYNGKRILGCGWDPERVARLYHRKNGHFSDAQVHETLLAPRFEKLHSPLLHTPYRSTADFLTKMQHYSTLFAQQYQNKKKSSFFKALMHGAYAFFRSYFLKRGLFCGAEGFLISMYNGNTAFYKYLKLAEANRKTESSENSPLSKDSRASRLGAYGVLIQDARILLTLKKTGPYKGLWDLPGGAIEFGETPEGALKRELQEETALAADQFTFLKIAVSNGQYEEKGIPYLFHHIGIIYTVSNPISIPTLFPEEEGRWVPLNEIRQEELTPFAKQALHR